jgi:UDP-N-acetyl-D-galactosamine dehydrogenase
LKKSVNTSRILHRELLSNFGLKEENINIIIVGLGYVGLPLAIEFGKKYRTFGVDINKHRITDLKQGIDSTLEASAAEIKSAQHLQFSSGMEELHFEEGIKNVFIVTVPTPIDSYKQPDLGPIKSASKSIGKVLKKEDIVIYESTVFPGCTEEECVPVLEEFSGLKYNQDFFCGYSPERINPGDKVNTLTKIRKVTSGSTEEIAEFVDNLYKSIIEAGTYKAASIKVAEAAKLIENCQRDVNISFVNELALIFDRMDIDTNAVLEAAGTKWNFLKFKPGLVGGHCIGVDPYYMINKAERLGYYPEVIGAGRRINDNMGVFIANKIIKLMINKDIAVKGSKTIILGFTFKENCPDIRNTRVVDIYNEMRTFGVEVDIYDPWASKAEVSEEYGIELLDKIESVYDTVVLAVGHREFNNLVLPKTPNAVVYDIKGFLDQSLVDSRL